MAGAGGGPRFAAPPRAPSPAPPPPSLQGRARASPPRPVGTPLCALAAPHSVRSARSPSAPAAPACSGPRRRRPHVTSAAGRAPGFWGAPWARACVRTGRATEQVRARPG